MAQVNDNDDIKWLYGKLKAKGYNIGSEAEFKSSLANGEDRKWYYEKAKGMGLDMGSMDDFESMYAPKAAPAPKKETPSFGQRKPASAVSASPEQPKKQKPKGTPMTEQDKIRMSLQMGQMKQQVQQGIANTNAKIGRMMEPLTQKGRERRRLGEFQARMAGTPTHVVGFNTASPAPAGSGARGGSQQKPVQSEQSPQPYGVKYENGKAKTQWILPDGTLTTSLIEANQAEYEARTARLAHQFQDRMKENGLDPNKPEDVRKQAQLDYEAPMRKAIEDEWQRAEAEDRAADEAYRKDMERAEGGGFWDRLKKSITPLGPDGMPLRRGDETLRDIKRAAKRQDTFNLEKMAQSVLQNMPQEYKDNQMLNYSRYFREHPSELKGRTVSQAAKEALQGEVYHATYERAVQARMPKSKTEFLLRKVADQPFFSQTMSDNMAARLFSHSIGTEAADMDAMGRYGTDHRALDITGTVLNMAIDPTTYISGGVGSFAGKQALKLSGKMALKGASKEAAERYVGRTLAGRMVAGVAAGSANFGTFEGLKNMQQQMRLGGTLNPETGEYEFSAGDMLKATGHGMLLGSVTGTLSPVLGNVSDKLVKATESTAGKVGIRAGELMTSTVAEGTIFATPEWIENAQLADDDPRKRKAMDIWTDNMAMMLGFKVSHGIKSAPQVIAGLRPIAEPKTMEERNHNRRSFAERLRKRMDASPRDLDFTKEEREELRRNGYGDLASLFTRTPKQPNKPKAKPTMTDGKTMTFNVDFQHAKAERVSNPEFDGYEAMERLMQDPNVSQSARAKAYYILTGRMLPMGTVTGYTTNKDANGVTVQAMTAQGEVVTSRHFKTEEEAKKEEANIMRQAELNSVDVGERYKEAAANAKVVQAAVESVAPGADFATVMRNYKAVKEGDKDAIAAYGKMVEDIDRAIEANKSMADDERPEAIRASIKEETGVDVDATLRKEPKNRTEEEQAAVEDYIKRLFPEQKSEEAGASAEAEQPMSEAESAAAAAYDQARLLWDKVEKGDTDAKAEVDAITLRMQEAYQMCEDAFGADAEMRIAEINEDPWPLVNNPELSEDQQDAVLYYVNAKAAMEGVMDASNEAADGKRKDVEANVERHTHKDMGVVQPATMKVDDKPVYVVKGNVVMLPDGSGIDVRNSDQSIVICDAETGEYKFASPDQLFSLGESIDPQTELEEAYANIQAEHEAVLGVHAGENMPQTSRYSVNEDAITSVSAEEYEKIRPQINVSFYAEHPERIVEDLQNEATATAEYLNGNVDAREYLETLGYATGENSWLDNSSQDEIEQEATAKAQKYQPYLQDNGESVQETPENVQNDGENVPRLTDEQMRQYAQSAFNEATQSDGITIPQEQAEQLQQHNQQMLEQEQQRKEEEANRQPTALERVPINEETGEPMFEKADRETALDALNEVTGGNDENTTAIVRAQVEQATKALEALKKKEPTKKAPSLKGSPMAMVKAQQEAEANYNTAMEEYNAKVAAAEENLNAWSRINSLMNDRKRAIREQQEAERKVREEKLHAEAVARLEEDKRIAAEKAAEQEAVGTHAVNSKIKAKWDGATKFEGNPNAITLADGSTIRGHYVLTEAGAATASHDVNNAYEPTEGFPVDENGESVNDRDYKRDKDAQRIVRDMADSYDSRALQTPVIVSKDGVVLSGNNRTMSGDIAAQQGTDKAYIDHLREFGQMYGFTPEQIDGMKHPRVVFVPDEHLPYDATTFARFNAEQQKKQSKPEHAVKLGKIVPDNVFTSITNDISRFDRMSDYYADDKSVASAISQLLDAGVINEMQLPELRTGNALSAAGKELIENTLIGKVFQTSPDAVRQIISTPTLRQSVVMGLNEIANNRTLAKSGYDLSKELAAAVDLVSRAKSDSPEIYKEGMPVSPYGRQQGLFDDEYGDSRVTDGVTLLLADLLNSGKPSDLRKVLSTYNNEAASPAAGQIDMFSGDVTSKEEVLNNVLNHFRNATPREQQAIVDAAIAERKRRAEAAEPVGGSHGSKQTENAVRGSEETEVGKLSVNGGRGDKGRIGERQGDLQSEEKVTAKLSSDKTDEYGKPLVIAKDGTTTFGIIDPESGLKEAPIQLSLGENHVGEDGKNHGYGLLHIEAGHGEQIRAAGFSSVEDFVEEVAKNYVDIREGAKIGDNQTYLLEVTDNHNNTLFVQLSKDVTYWNVNSAGIFNVKYSRRKPKVYSVPALGEDTNTDTSEVNSGHAEGVTAPAGNSSKTSVSKVINNQSTLQENSEKSVGGEGETSLSAQIETASAEVNTDPTEAQKKAGNYKKGHVQVGTFDITIEQPQGSVRKGTDADGKQWESKMNNTYGYIRGAVGVDGDHIDVFLSNDIDGWNGRKVFVVDQYNPDGSFDEHKVMLGFNDQDEAKGDYLANYEQGWENGRRIDITGVNLEDFEKWIESSKRKTKPFGEYSSVKKDVVEINTPEEAGYSITPSTYTNKKGKTSDVSLLTFDHDLTADQERAVKEFAKERTGEGRFAPARGWKDRESGGWMFRSEEDARKAAEMVGNDDAVTDNQPLTAQEMRDAAEPKKPATRKKATAKKPANRVEVADAKEQKPTEPTKTEQPKQDGEKKLVISDEMKHDEDILRELLGIGDDEMDGGMKFRDPDALTSQQRRQVYNAGVNYSLGYIDQGFVSFPEFTKAMVSRLGYKIKPWLKSFYEGAKRIPGYDQAMFTQFKMGTISGERSFDEGDADENGNIDPAQMVALLSGNPIIFEKSKQDKLVKKLKSLYNGFLRDQQRKRQNYETVTKKVDNLKRLISLSDSDVHDLQREGFKPDEKGTYPSKVKVCVEGSYYGQDFDKPKEAGQYILEQLKNNKKVVLAGFGQRADVVFVTGDDLLSSHYEVQLGGNNAWSIRYTKRMPQDPTQAGLVFRSLLEQIIHNNEVYHREYDTNSEMLKTMPKGDAPFPKQKELDEAIAKQKELDAEYNKLGQSEEDKTKFRLLDEDDPKAMELESLPESELVPVYRNVQAFEDDALGSPMAFTDAETGERRTLEGRRWNYSAPPKVELTEEQQRKLDELNKNGYIMVDGKKSTELQINDGLKFVKPKTKEAQLQYFLKKNPEDKGLWAAYDPYDHAIETPLNTQFGEAYKRPNLVVVRSLIPKSEIDEPFHADYALLPTGAHQWNNGRTLYLSRWSKIDKVLTREEEAKLIDEYWKKHPGKREELKTHRDYNRFVPQVRRELEKMGYRFELDGKELTPEESLALDKQNWESRDVIPGREGHTPFVNNEDIARINAKMAGKWVGEPKEAMESAMSERVTELSERLHTPVRIIRTEEEVAALPSVRQRRMKGSFNPMTGEVTIVVPNNANMADVENTFVHEVVGHDGLRVLFPDEAKLNNALDELYRVSKDEIRGTIDRMTQKMYDAEVDRIREKKRKEHVANGEDANASYYADMAEAHAEASKKREQFKRDATEEYGADLAGRIGEKGFEKMSAEELTFWGKLKAMLQKALQKLLDGLKIPGKRKWGDKDWAFVLHEAYKRKKNGGKPTVFDAADTEVMRRKTGFGDTKFSDGKREQQTANERFNNELTRYQNGEMDKNEMLHLGRPQGVMRTFLPNLPIVMRQRVIKKGSEKKHEVDVSAIMNMPQHLSSPIFVFQRSEDTIGVLTDMRDRNGKNVCVAIELKRQIQQGAEYLEVNDVRSFHGREFKNIVEPIANNKTLKWVDKEKGLAYLSSASQPVQQEIDKQVLDTAAKVVKDFVNPKVSDENVADEGIMFRDGDMGLEETITKMKVEASQANADNWQAKQDAMRAIGGNLNKLRQAMARQREYDLSTVKSITDLAKVLLENGLLDDLSKYETKRILSAVNNVHGKQDVSDYVQKVMDIMVDNQLRMGANQLGKLLSIRGSRVDARGIEVQGQLDPEGQRIAQVVRKATSLPKENIEERIADCTNRMSSGDNAVAEEAAIEYSGLLLAHQFVEDITESKAEEKALRESIKEAKADLDAGTMEADAYREYVESTNDAIRQNKIERAEAYRSIVEQVGGVLGGSVERAKAWREAEKQRVETIHHNANSDMTGRPNDEHHKESKAQKIANNSIVRFVLAPLGTFDQMLRMFGKKSVNGEGYLWNRYMRGWVEATEKEYTGYQNALKTLDEKVSEVFDKKMKWGDLFSLERNLPKATVTFWDGGEQKAHELTQGNLLYIYMVDKMADGRMKLRRMGITEEDVENIKEFVDPRFLELADWMQDEFLVEKRNEYNEVHKRMFGASMAAIENYFPLKILANARIEEVDVADDTTDTALPATSTGSIIKRRRNNLALDVMGADAFSVILDHIQQMERWASFAEFNRDLNTLLSYKRFRNQVMNMTSVYGGGKTLWKNFRNVCSMAAGAYRPPIAQLDKAAVNIAKGVTAAKVSFRVFTALKQFLSMPAYLSDSSPVYLAGNIANPIGAWKWSMENLPLFEKRWKSRMAGDPRLMKSEMDWKMWQNRAVEIASRIGMSPNAFVDALTVAIGAHSMYQTKKKKYLRYGYDEETAEKRAKQDATILFNQTQQSSESAFLSTMQTDRSWLSVLFTVFRNSSMSYTRQLYDALRNLKHRFEPGYKGLTEEYLAKQMRRDGIDPDKADQNAKSEYRRSLMRDIVRVGVFGYLLQFAWNLGAYLPYLLLGDDKDEKSDMWHDIFCHTMFGSIEGLTGGDVMSAVGNGFAKGEGLNLFSASKDMPLSSDLQNIVNKWNKDKVAAMNDVTNLMVQSGIGVNPQSLTDAVVAIMDYCGDDANTSRECALLITRIINCPQSQIDKIYFDELNATAAEAQVMTPAEIAERYARYKMHRSAPLTGWSYTDEARDSVMTAQQNRVLTKAKEKLNSRMETEETKQLLSDYDAVAKQETALSKIKKTDRAAYREGMKQLRQSNDMRQHMRLKRYKHDMKELTSKYLRCKSAEERNSIVSTMFSTRAKMLEDIGRLKQQ